MKARGGLHWEQAAPVLLLVILRAVEAVVLHALGNHESAPFATRGTLDMGSQSCARFVPLRAAHGARMPHVWRVRTMEERC